MLSRGTRKESLRKTCSVEQRLHSHTSSRRLKALGAANLFACFAAVGEECGSPSRPFDPENAVWQDVENEQDQRRGGRGQQEALVARRHGCPI